MIQNADLPSFAAPPIIETVLGVQFEPIAGLRTAHLGLLWSRFRSQYSKTEDKLPLASSIETLDDNEPERPTIQLQVELVDAPPVPRVWFISDDDTRVIQVQQDRLIHNWRKRSPKDEYPRYAGTRAAFDQALDELQQFLADEDLGELAPNQCEVTYVSEMIAGQGWEHLGQLGQILTLWSPTYSEPFLPEAQDATVGARYVIRGDEGQPLGRLTIQVQPARDVPTGRPAYILRMTAQGKPNGEGIEGIRSFLDVGREWIVRGFAAVTTPHMHQLWEREDGPRR